MIRAQTERETTGVDISAKDVIEGPRQRGLAIRLMAMLAATIAIVFAPPSARAQAKRPSLPYVTIDHPQFISTSQATFLSPHDLLIGVTDGKSGKAYPAAILAQHGVVQDRMPDGPIAVTW